MDFEYTEDPLTGLLSHKSGLQRYREQTQKNAEKPFALFMIAIDAIKVIHDRYGHLAHDKAIRVVSHVLYEFWTEEFAPTRYGDSWFAALLVGKNLNDVAMFAENFRATMENRSFLEFYSAAPVRATVSIGIAYTSNSGSSNIEQAVLRAKELMAQAYESGGNRVNLKPTSN